MLERRKIIGTVAYMGGIMSLPEPFAWSWGQMLLRTQSQCAPGDYIQPDRATVSLHDHARAQVISRMRGDWIVMLDCDTEFESDLVTRLVGVANRHSLDVVTGVYSFKNPPHSPVIYMYNRETGVQEPIRRWDRKYEVFPIDAAGAGCLFIRRNVIETILKELNEQPFARTGSSGEDMGFFRRLKKIGVQAWCAWQVEVAHLAYSRLRPSVNYDPDVFDINEVRGNEYPAHGLNDLKVAAYG